MKVMIDVNILLDYFQKRLPFYHFSSIVISEVLKRNVYGVTPCHAITVIHYIISKYANKHIANEKIDWLLEYIDIISGNKELYKHARNLNISDFEDAIVSAFAEDANCDYIVSRNISDFRESQIQTITPEDFVIKHVNIT